MERPPETTKERWLYTALQIAFVTIIGLALTQLDLENLEFFSYDLRFRLKPQRSVSGKVEIVTISRNTLEHLRGQPNATHYRIALQKIAAQNPAAIVQLIYPDEIPGTPAEKQALAETIADLPSFYVPLKKAPLEGFVDASLRLPPPFAQTRLSVGMKTRDRTIMGKDNVARRVIVEIDGLESLHSQLARQTAHPEMSEPDFRGQFNWLDGSSRQVFINFNPPHTYQPISFEQILSQNAAPTLQGRIVIIGPDTRNSTGDYVTTPHSRDILAMSVPELHANMFDTLIRDDGVVRWPKWVSFVMMLIISFFTARIVLRANPVRGLLALAGVIAGYTLLGWGLFAIAGIWLEMVTSYLAIFICYYFFIPYRLIVENRRSWEYYQKHRLLKRVEELKSNFLSMMSHDLKTPIARIQGMADLISKEEHRLNPEQQTAIKTIRQSSEELAHFISSILDLGRVESQDVKLQLQIRDVNALLKEVIAQHEFLATQKGIEIKPELEPLFSIKMDIELMRQVFANLIENSIKYSPAGSKVLVTSEEVEGKIVVQVADQGQGIPPEELDDIFTKFYRSKEVKNSPTKGSGLGLYLAKYFVDLHHGAIFVESTYLQGSTFTVQLPVQLPQLPSELPNQI